jgi:uncharacterized UBP type Zn finger protein
LIKAFKNAKKLALISGKELKSVVIRGRLLENIIYKSFDKNSESKAKCSFYRIAVNNATNSCYLVSGIQS